MKHGQIIKRGSETIARDIISALPHGPSDPKKSRNLQRWLARRLWETIERHCDDKSVVRYVDEFMSVDDSHRCVADLISFDVGYDRTRDRVLIVVFENISDATEFSLTRDILVEISGECIGRFQEVEQNNTLSDLHRLSEKPR